MTFSKCGHGTHVGNVRAHNEDNYAVDAETGFGVLADGMGGHEGGEIASQIVVDCVSADIQDGKLMTDALAGAHQAVLDAVNNGQGRKGMGSTAVAIKLDDRQFEIVWVGDSRAYCWDGKKLVQMTKDHSLVQSMVDEGTITAEEARYHPQRNYITQSIGMSGLDGLEIGHVQGEIFRQHQFLLCSDGLSGEVDHAEISEILELDASEQEKADLLIQKAVENGGSDNVTVVLFSAPGSSPETAPITASDTAPEK